MIGNFALTRINLAVAAALLALIGALFVVLQPAGAQTAVTGTSAQAAGITYADSVSVSVIVLVTDTDVYAWANSATETAVSCGQRFRINLDATATGAPLDSTTFIEVAPNGPVESRSINDFGGPLAVTGPTAFKVWGWVGAVNAQGDPAPDMTGRDMAAHTVTTLPTSREASCATNLPDGYRYSLSIGDSDNIIPAGSVVTVTVNVLDAAGNPSDRPLPTIQPFSVDPTPSVFGRLSGNRLIFGEGTANGTYRIGALSVYDDGGSTTGYLDVTVGNPGTEVGSISLGFGYQDGGLCITEDVAEAKTDTDGDPAPIARDDAIADASLGEGICIVATVRNSLGNPANEVPGDIIVAAFGGSINNNPNSNEIAFSTARGAGFKVTRQGAGRLTVSAQAASAGGFVTSNSLALTFSGAAETISLGEASGNLTLAVPDLRIDVPITAADAAGNSAEVPGTVSATFANAAGEAVSHFEYELGYPGTATAGPRAFKVGLMTGVSEVPAGVYTMTARLGQETAEATFAVAGGAASILLTADQSTGLRFGSIVTVTATIRDANGFAIADQPVGASDPATNGATFLAAGNLDTFAFTTGRQAIEDGQSLGQFLVTGNEGQSVIIARVGDISTSIIITSAGASAAPVGGAVSLDCLSSLNNFSAWLCAESASASQIFDLVQARGATALHLWNGTAWVRYATVGGSLVPGSSNFTVDSGDVLYVSN